MSFFEEILEHNKPIWDECINTPFIQQLKSGKLPNEKFKRYMIQDSIYLKAYARIYGKAIYLSQSLRDIQTYYSILSFVTDSESAVRLDYLKKFGTTDDEIELIEPFPENKAYIDFMLEVAENDNIPEILMAILPCMLSYSYIFTKIESDSKESEYYDFISDYAQKGYSESCVEWCYFAQKKCKNTSETERKKLFSIFEKASYCELDFWKMAFED